VDRRTLVLTAVRWWILFMTAIFVIAAWPPAEGRSLLTKAVAWAVDPLGRLPMLPEQLGLGLGDDPQAVEARDAEVRRYDDLFNSGPWMRTRLQLKTATDPFDPTTERQVLLLGATAIAFLLLKRGRG
jgi:hypothetical protein